MILALLAALNGAAQQAFVVYEGAESSYFVEEHTGSTYFWNVLTDFSPDIEANPNDYTFTTANNLHQVSIRWNKVGLYFVNIVETDITGCPNRKALAVNVVSNNRSIGFNTTVSSECYNPAGNGFGLPLKILDNGGVPLGSDNFPVLVSFTVNGNAYTQNVSYDQQVLNISSSWFSAQADLETNVKVQLSSAQDNKGLNIPLANGNDIHNRSIYAIPQLQFVSADASVDQSAYGSYEVEMTTGNMQNANYSWSVNPVNGTSDDLSLINTSNADILWDGPYGTYKLNVMVTDGNGCTSDYLEMEVEVSDPGDTSIVEPPILIIYAGPDTTIASCNPYYFADVFPSADTFTYLWEPAQYLSDPTIPNPVFTPGETTTYTLTVTTFGGYTGKDTVTITVNETEKPQLEYLSIDNPVDEYSTGQYEAGMLKGEPQNAVYHWSVTPSFGTSTDLSAITGPVAEIDWKMLGRYTLGVSVIDGNGCTSDTITQLIEVNKSGSAPIPLTAGPDTTIGSCEPYQFTGVYPVISNYTYSWEPTLYLSDPNVPTPVFTPGETTTYILTVSNTAGVSVSDTLVITVSDVLANAGSDVMMETGSTVMLDGSQSSGKGLLYLWTTKNGTIEEGADTDHPLVSQPGIYYLKVTDAYDCNSIDSVVVSLYANAPVARDVYDTTSFQTSVTIDVLANDTDPDGNLDPTSLHITDNPVNGVVDINYAENTIIYTPNQNFTGTDVFEYEICDLTQLCDNAKVYVLVTAMNFLIPEAFSPNGDNINDFFEILGIEYYPNNSITIINRWGKKVYEAKAYGIETYPIFWDGKASVGGGNEDLPTGTYFYVLDLGNGEKPIAGSVYIDR